MPQVDIFARINKQGRGKNKNVMGEKYSTKIIQKQGRKYNC